MTDLVTFTFSNSLLRGIVVNVGKVVRRSCLVVGNFFICEHGEIVLAFFFFRDNLRVNTGCLLSKSC